jgi:hypothetical protein
MFDANLEGFVTIIEVLYIYNEFSVNLNLSKNMRNLSDFSFIISLSIILTTYLVLRYLRSSKYKSAKVFKRLISNRRRELTSKVFVVPDSRLDLQVQYLLLEAKERNLLPLEILKLLASFTIYEEYIQKNNPLEDLDVLERYFDSR